MKYSKQKKIKLAFPPPRLLKGVVWFRVVNSTAADKPHPPSRRDEQLNRKAIEMGKRFAFAATNRKKEILTKKVSSTSKTDGLRLWLRKENRWFLCVTGSVINQVVDFCSGQVNQIRLFEFQVGLLKESSESVE